MPPLPPNVDNTAQLSAFQSYLDAYNAKDALLNGDNANPAYDSELEFEQQATDESFLTIEAIQLAEQNAQALLNSVQAKVDAYDAIMTENADTILEYFSLYPDSLGVYFPLTDQSISVYTGIISVYPGQPDVPPAFSPADLTGLFMWFKADTGVMTTGSLVDQWQDQSGNNNHISATGSLRPDYSSGDRVTYSGSEILSSSTLTLNTFKDTTIFIVAQNTGSVAGVLIETSNDFSTISGFAVICNLGTPGNISVYSNGSVGLDEDRILGSQLQPILIRGQIWRTPSAPDCKAVIDSDSTGSTHPYTSDNNNNFSNQPINIGGRPVYNNNFSGDIYEVVVYKNTLDISDIAKVEVYLKDKYGL